MSQDASPVLLAQRSRDSEAAMPAVEDFFHAVALRIRARLVNRSAADIEVRVAGVEVKPLGAVLEDSEYRENAVYGLMRFTPPGLPGLIVLQGALLSKIVGAMLGEYMDDEADPPAVRALTAVEQQIAVRVCNDVVSELKDAWPVSDVPRIEVDRPATSGRVVAGAVRSVAVFSATLDFGPPTNPYGLLSCNVPVQVFRNMGGPSVIEQEPQAERPVDFSRVMPLEVEMVAELAKISMSVAQIRALEVGHTLDVGPVRTATLKINGMPVMEGKPGEVDGHRSVQILRRLKG
jgi:flagellar motor switch protein FliM